MTSPERQRLFGLLDGLERDLNDFISHQLLRGQDESALLTAEELTAALARRDEADEDLIPFLDLSVKVDVSLRWKHLVDDFERPGLQALATQAPNVYPIRNRVMHGRPLRPEDTERAKEALVALAKSGFRCPRLIETSRRLEADPSWLPPGTVIRLPSRVINNLPDADYDDTGLIGRNSERDKLRTMLVERRWPVLSVVAPGGYGKTALALEVLHDLVDSDDCPYELVVWVSLKTEQLTVSGVQEIEDAVHSVSSALPKIGETLDVKLESAAELAEMLEGIDTLMVLDNLETATSDEVIGLIESMPADVRFLFTSRVGIGQLERRVPLDLLRASAAADLLRRLGRSRDIYLGGADQQQLLRLSEEVGFSPMALRWFAEGIHSGLDPQAVLENREDLVVFCVANVFLALPDDAKKLAWLLLRLGRPTPVPELHTAVPDWTIDRGRAAIQELVRRMFVVRTVLEGTLSEELDITEALRSYLRLVGPDPDWDREITNAVMDNELERERLRHDQAIGGLRPNVILGGPEHTAAQTELRRALTQSKKGEIDRSLEHVTRAEQIDPDFFEVYRVKAFVVQSQRPREASSAFERALELAPDEDSASVKYYFAGHLLRIGEETRAVELAREAHDALGRPKTAFQLADALRRSADLDGALRVLEPAIVDAGDRALQAMMATLAMNIRKRIAEMLAHDQSSTGDPVGVLLPSFSLATEIIRAGLRDEKLVREVIRCGSDLFRYVSQQPEIDAPSDAMKEAVQLLADVLPWARRNSATEWLRRNAEQAEPVLTRMGIHLPDVLVAQTSSSASQLGQIDWYDGRKGYGFIEAPALGQTYFVHSAHLVDPADVIFLMPGVEFEFAIGTDADGREQATQLILRDNGDLTPSLLDRQCHVFVSHDGYSLARDDATGVVVFVGRHQLRAQQDWQQVEPGRALLLDVRVEPDGRFRAADGSVRLG